MIQPSISLNGKRVLITGIAGFIGSYTAKKIMAASNAVVIGVDNINDYYDVRLKMSRLDEVNTCAEHNGIEYHFIKADISEQAAVKRIFAEHAPDIVIHLAAQAGVRYSIENPDIYILSNIVGFFNILEACRHSYDNGMGVQHLIYASSSSVYGENSVAPYSTVAPANSPVSLYAATKKSDEMLAYAYSKMYSIPSTGLRFFTVYGPAGRPDMAYYKFADRLCGGGKIQIFNYGDCERDFTYIDDIVEGIFRVTVRPPERRPGKDGLPAAPHKIYNIGNSHPEHLMNFVEILSSELIQAGVLPDKFRLEDHLELKPMQPGDVEVTYADVSELEEDCGFKPKTALNEGIKKFAAWYGAVLRRNKYENLNGLDYENIT